MLPTEIINFLQEYAAGTNTEAAHQQFISWLKNAPIQDAAEALDQYRLIADSHSHPFTDIDPSVASHIEAALNQYELGRPAATTVIKAFPWKRFTKMAAAVLILFLASTAVWLYNRKPLPPALANTATKPQLPLTNELLPGGNKAMLTLSNGSVIALDDAKNGRIARQGNAVVNKSASGQLVYQASDAEPAAVVYNTLTTPRGGQFKLVLPDGSEVWLNAASSIKYPTSFSGDERRVEITGEAYFEIAHNAAKPFTVTVNGMQVKVLGTHFNINAYSDEAAVKTSLLQGSIRLVNGSHEVLLQPGQQAQLESETGIKVVTDVDMDDVVAWKNGYFSFNHADLRTVMRQIARWYDVEISYQGKIPQRLFGGKIDRNSNASEVLKILEESKVHFTIDNKKIIVQP